MEVSPEKPIENALWERLRELDEVRGWPGAWMLKALIARSFFVRHEGVITRLHPQLTLHDLRHGEAVACLAAEIGKGARLLDAHNIHALSAEELYYLIAACYLHDVGLAVIHDKEDLAKVDASGKPIHYVLRQCHHERSKEYVRKHAEELHLTGAESRILGFLCQAHRMSETLGQSPYKDYPARFGKRTRIPLLAAVLRVADEMDLDYSRAPEQVRELWDNVGWFDDVSRTHWLKHYYTLASGIESVQTGGEQLMVRPRVTVRIPREANTEYYKTKLATLIEGHLNQEIASVQGATEAAGFSFGETVMEYVEEEGLSMRFLQPNEVQILLVDDNETYASSVRDALKVRYGEIEVASTAMDAVAAITLAPHRFHAAIIDLNMPRFTKGESEIETGIVLIRNLRKVALDTAIIANTGHREAKWETRAKEAGADVFRVKSGGKPGAEVADLTKRIQEGLSKLGYEVD